MAKLIYDKNGRLLFTKEMKQEYTILIPNMLPVTFKLLEKIFTVHGYKVKLLDTNSRKIVDEGLKDVHNDTCYPALLVVGQLLDALKSGDFDINKTALFMSQTGGGCRASNYINLIRKALKNNGLSQVPVISFNLANLEKNPGFKFTLKLTYQLVAAVCYGDVLMWAANQVRPYEITKGETDKVLNNWIDRLIETKIGFKDFEKNAAAMLKDFENIKVTDEVKPKVGIVGEIYIKFAPLGNNCLQQFLEYEGAEAVIPGLLDFVIFMCDHHVVDTQIYHTAYKKFIASALLEKFLLGTQKKIIKAFKSSRFRCPSEFENTKKLATEFVSNANKMGEGWLLTGEMLELIHSGVDNIVCAQPFGCLPNHVVGKGMIRGIRGKYPDSNIVAIDYDPGATAVNQENRIKLMLSTARENMRQKSK